MTRLLTVRISREEDVVAARQRARQVAAALGFEGQDQTRLSTVVSELARNASRYAGGGTVEFTLDNEAGALVVMVADRGPGIPHLDEVLAGTYRSETGMGLGIVGARRLMDTFAIDSTPGSGTTVRVSKVVPRRRARLSAVDVGRIAQDLTRQPAPTPVDEVQQQNRELLEALAEIGRRQQDLARLTAELQDTNRGVVALYAELDEKAEHLRQADAMKSRFLSNMSHEFQTPLNSILALTRLLLDRADGDLTTEQEKQVKYIRDATEDLSELVHDLLDIAKVEAGAVTVRRTDLSVSELFGTLRGLMRPLQRNPAVSLVFEDPGPLPPLVTDDGKVAQILRNYISNALKFTEHGEVRVSVENDRAGSILFKVRDTGIGIAAADQAKLFQEFGQVPNRLQAKVRGTGLGLSLSKRLAELLGGSVGVESTPGNGSTFWLSLPASAVQPAEQPPAPPRRAPIVLVIDDELTTRYVLRRYLEAAGCNVIEAAGGEEGLTRAMEEHPDGILLDLSMPGMLGTEVLARLKRDAATASIPVIIATSLMVPPAEQERLRTHAVAVLSKSQLGKDAGDEQLRGALTAAGLVHD